MVTLFRRTGPAAVLVLVLVTTVGCDRVTKKIAVERLAGAPERTFLAGTVRLLYAENTGGFLSLGAELSPGVRAAVFVGATGVLLFATLFGMLRQRHDVWAMRGAALFLGGGASNLLDRLAAGKVVDFLNVGVGPLRTGVFNVADVAIMAGLALLLWTQGFRDRRPAG